MLNISATVTSSSGASATTTTTASTSSYADGLSGAPAGTPQFPALLNGYAVRPPWNVAGVDYRVGINAGITLKSPTTLPTSGSPRVSGALIYLDVSNSVLDGYDCTGYQVIIQGAVNNCVIRNCKFAYTDANHDMTTLKMTGTGTLIEYCEFYGNYFMGATWGAQLFFGTSPNGGATIQYCYMERAGADFIDLYAANSNGPYVIRYNCVGKSAMTGSHPDWLQMFCTGTITEIDITYNTFFSIPLASDVAGLWGAANTMPNQGTQGLGPSAETQATSNGPVTVSNNVLISGGSMNHLVGAAQTQYTNIGPSYSLTVQQNYFDATNSTFITAASGPTNIANNKNMVTGATYP